MKITDEMVQQAVEILRSYGLITHPWDEASLEAMEAAIGDIFALAAAPATAAGPCAADIISGES